jgi:hypothetical protein
MASFLTGLRLADWRRLLRENAPAVDWLFVPKAGAITLATVATSLLARLEPVPRLTPRQQDAWERPVFVLGLPRSGTTLLQGLLALNPEVAYASRLDCFNPHTFLALRRLGAAWLVGRLPRRTRGIDNVQIGWLTPDEDEFALTILTVDGPWLGGAFPRSARQYKQHCPANPDWEGGAAWQSALATFTRKLVGLHDRPLVLKSPLHTMRIPDILAVFPKARFVTIVRDPRDQMRSVNSIARRARVWPSLQSVRQSEEQFHEFNRVVLERYFKTRHQIDPDRLLEITYEDLVAAPHETLRRLHDRMNLPGLSAVLSRFDADPVWRAYRRNTHQPLSGSDVEQLKRWFAPLFQAGYYRELVDAAG